jgi:integrase
VARPYTVEEIRGLKDDARAQPTADRVRAARALLTLGAGAGLDGRWVAKVAAADIIDRAGTVLVRVGEPAPRVVPVLPAWQDEVIDMAETAGGEVLVGGTSTARNRAGALAASIVVAHGHPKLSASRLRSTWLVTHLAMGTRMPELVKAAGLQGITVLSDLLLFVPALDDAMAVEMLRGRS